MALKTPTMLEQLLEEINFQRTKEMRQMLKDESGFVVLQGTSYWTDLFVRHFLFQEERSIDCDDLLFFVRKRHVKGSSRYLPKYETEVEVFRKDSKKLPIGDPEVDWEETVYLNLVVHQFEYALTLGVCTRTSPKELQVVRRCSQRVYASPSRRKMDSKGESEEITYPHICFMVDNFDEVFNDIVVRDGEMVCVELTAKGRGCSSASVIFLGSIRYDALARVYDTRQTSLSTRVAQRMSFGLLGGKAAARCEFVRMKGPGGKGHAEMAVSKPHGAGVDTPSSEPGVCATDMWDSDWEDDPDDMMVYRNQRRLSDPSANIHNFVRGGIRTKDARDKSRSENEGLDSLVSGIAEIEGGDLRDESRASSGPWCCVPPRSRKGLGGLQARPHSVPTADPGETEYGPPPLKPFTLNIKKTPSKQKKKETKDKESKEKECEMADDVASLNETQILCCETKRRTVKMDYGITVRGKEELPCYRESHVYNLMRRTETKTPETNGNEGDDESEDLSLTNRGARAYCTLPRKHDGAASIMFRNGKFPPRRTTPDGTDIYYWCDVPKKKWRELDDGAYNPLWAMRGFTQSFHLWKEGRRQQSTPLNAYLTYVTLPWWSIAKDILDHREEPILTF